MPRTALLFATWALLTTPIYGDGVEFQRDVRPILVKHCVSCHGARSQKAKLRLDAATLIHQGGDSGTAVIAKQPAKSLLLQRITSKDPDLRMPAEAKPLSQKDIAVIRAWIAQGAAVPANETIPAGPEDHWAWKAPRRSKRLAAGGNVIDLYFDSLHKQKKVETRPTAGREHLLRRVSLDLVGLPPTASNSTSSSRTSPPEPTRRSSTAC